MTSSSQRPWGESSLQVLVSRRLHQEPSRTRSDDGVLNGGSEQGESSGSAASGDGRARSGVIADMTRIRRTI